MRRLPSVKPRELIATLKQVGFIEHHQKGSHLYLWHPDKRRMTCIPIHPGDVNRALLLAILEQADLSHEEFIDLL